MPGENAVEDNAQVERGPNYDARNKEGRLGKGGRVSAVHPVLIMCKCRARCPPCTIILRESSQMTSCHKQHFTLSDLLKVTQLVPGPSHARANHISGQCLRELSLVAVRSQVTVRRGLELGHHTGVTKMPQVGIHERFCTEVMSKVGRGVGSKDNSRMKKAAPTLVTTKGGGKSEAGQGSKSQGETREKDNEFRVNYISLRCLWDSHAKIV